MLPFPPRPPPAKTLTAHFSHQPDGSSHGSQLELWQAGLKVRQCICMFCSSRRPSSTSRLEVVTKAGRLRWPVSLSPAPSSRFVGEPPKSLMLLLPAPLLLLLPPICFDFGETRSVLNRTNSRISLSKTEQVNCEVAHTWWRRKYTDFEF